MIDVARARRETPGCEKVVHFNNAGASLMPQPVLDAISSYLQLEAELGGYEAEDRQRKKLENVYDLGAQLINAHRDEIALVENATRAWDMVFYSLRFEPGDKILTSASEYVSNYIAFLQVVRRTGAVIEVVPDDDCGQISVQALRDAIDDRAKLIALTHVPTNGGLVNPAEAVGKIAREAGVFYLLDACQSAGQMPIDVRAIGCDMLTTTSRKFLRGPRGIGLLYVKSSVIEQLEPPFLDLRAADWVERNRYEIRRDARRFESWETSCALRLGFGAAVEYALGWGLDAIGERVSTLAEEFRVRLDSIRNVTVRDLGARRCGIVSFTVDGAEPESVRKKLAEHVINVSTSPIGYARLDMENRKLSGLVRASVHYYNNEEEIELFCRALKLL